MKAFLKGQMLSKMLVLTVNAHQGQFDKGERPYILHPLRVMHRLRSTDEEQQCIALGHDVVEDCGVTYQQLADLGMSQRVIDGIRCLTKVPGETYEEYKQKVKSNWDSVVVKLEDLRDNSDVRRLKGLSDKDFERLRRYQAFWSELKQIQDLGYEAWSNSYTKSQTQER